MRNGTDRDIAAAIDGDVKPAIAVPTLPTP